MKAETITFRQTSELRQGLQMLWSGIKTTGKAIGVILDKSAHRFPYAWIFVIGITCVVVSVINIGQARAERDALTKDNYELQQKLTSAINELEACGKEVR